MQTSDILRVFEEDYRKGTGPSIHIINTFQTVKLLTLVLYEGDRIKGTQQGSENDSAIACS